MHDGERLSPTETPAEVSCLFLFLFTLLTRIRLSQRSMEDGDVIDAHLQQARVHLISHSLRHLHISSARRLLMPALMVYSCMIWRVISTCLSTLCPIGSFFVVPIILPKTHLCLIWSFNQQFLGKPHNICTSPAPAVHYVMKRTERGMSGSGL